MKTTYAERIKKMIADIKVFLVILLKKIKNIIVTSALFCWRLLKLSLPVIIALILLVLIPLGVRKAVWHYTELKPIAVSANQGDLLSAQQDLSGALARVNRKLNAKKPRSYYMVINSSSNEFVLYKGNEVIKKDKCSTGSYILLKNGDNQQWMFKTPKGEFHIHGKTTSPVWRKPDWAFVEEGLPVPSENHFTRYEYGVLGDYALSLGHGYLIHGTLYQRFLGLPVTHGCIRLNDQNLELVYNLLPIGAKVYIY